MSPSLRRSIACTACAAPGNRQRLATHHFQGRSLMHRRDLLKASAALALAGIYLPRPANAATPAAADNPSRLKTLGQPQPFDYAWLKGRARTMAQQAYKVQSGDLPAKVAVLPPRPVLQAGGADP
jgi:hypothetical protein